MENVQIKLIVLFQNINTTILNLIPLNSILSMHLQAKYLLNKTFIQETIFANKFLNQNKLQL